MTTVCGAQPSNLVEHALTRISPEPHSLAQLVLFVLSLVSSPQSSAQLVVRIGCGESNLGCLCASPNWTRRSRWRQPVELGSSWHRGDVIVQVDIQAPIAKVKSLQPKGCRSVEERCVSELHRCPSCCGASGRPCRPPQPCARPHGGAQPKPDAHELHQEPLDDRLPRRLSKFPWTRQARIRHQLLWWAEVAQPHLFQSLDIGVGGLIVQGIGRCTWWLRRQSKYWMFVLLQTSAWTVSLNRRAKGMDAGAASFGFLYFERATHWYLRAASITLGCAPRAARRSARASADG